MAFSRQLKILLLIALLLACSTGIAFGFLLLILGCALWNSWWSLFAIALYLIAPIPDLLAKLIYNIRGSSIDEIFADKPSVSLTEHMGAFFTALLSVLGVGLNFILFHSNIIPLGTFLFQIFGGLVIAITILSGLAVHRIIMFREKSDSFDL